MTCRVMMNSVSLNSLEDEQTTVTMAFWGGGCCAFQTLRAFSICHTSFFLDFAGYFAEEVWLMLRLKLTPILGSL